MIKMFKPFISKEAQFTAYEVVRSTMLNQGSLVDKFEKGLSKFGIHYPVTLNSCTSALHLALDLIGIKEGDEVILPPQTFIATGLVILMARGVPVFADIDPKTGNIDPSKLQEKITKKTKAIIVVHWAGYPCDMDEIYDVAGDIPIIEDAAHAFGAEYKGRIIGNKSKSRFICFSFQAIKHLTTGDGGCLGCRDEEDYKVAKRKRWFGIDKDIHQPGNLGEREYDIDCIGYKYHMNDYTAALGLANLNNVESHIAGNRSNGMKFMKRLSPINVTLDYKEDRKSAYWFFPLIVKNRKNFIAELKNLGIECSIVHRRIDLYKVFQSFNRGKLTGQDKFTAHHVGIPCYSHLRPLDREHIIESVLWCYNAL